MKAVLTSSLIAVSMILCALLYSDAQGPPPPPTIGAVQVGFADVTPIPGQTIVVLRDPQGADQIIVTTFFWQNLPGISQPILRNVTSVIPAVKDVAVSADGSPDPKRVSAVHLSLVKITSRMEWNPATSAGPPPISPQPPVQ